MTAELHGRPTVPEVLPLVHALYRGEAPCTRGSGGVGGHLHVVLDDGNVEHGHVRWCLDSAVSDGCGTCADLARLMLRMTPTQRGVLSSRAYEKPTP